MTETTPLAHVEHSSIAAALAAFQGEMPTVSKSNEATVQGKEGRSGYRYRYADLADIMRAAAPILARHGLAFTTSPGYDTEQRTWLLTGTLMHESGGTLTGVLPIYGSTPQQWGSGITYMRRYLLGALTGIVTDEDDDGAAAQQGAQQRQQQDRPAPQQQRGRPQPNGRPDGPAPAGDAPGPQTDTHEPARPAPHETPGGRAQLAAVIRDVTDVLGGFEPGKDRDDALRGIFERAASAGLNDGAVPVPASWRGPDDPETVKLGQLITGARRVPSAAVKPPEPAGEPADDAPADPDYDPWASTADGHTPEGI